MLAYDNDMLCFVLINIVLLNCIWGLVLERWYCSHSCSKAQEQCEGRGGRRELAIPNNLHGLCGRKATLNSYLAVTSLSKYL